MEENKKLFLKMQQHNGMIFTKILLVALNKCEFSYRHVP
jgi:hypothetical protein